MNKSITQKMMFSDATEVRMFLFKHGIKLRDRLNGEIYFYNNKYYDCVWNSQRNPRTNEVYGWMIYEKDIFAYQKELSIRRSCDNAEFFISPSRKKGYYYIRNEDFPKKELVSVRTLWFTHYIP